MAKDHGNTDLTPTSIRTPLLTSAHRT